MPIVIGPDDVPRVGRGASVELAVLSTMTHGEGEEGGAVAAAALLAIHDAAHLDDARKRLYDDVVMASIDAIAGWRWRRR